MTQTVKLQDGTIAEFPDDMSQEEMQQKINERTMTWGDVGSDALENLPSSAKKFGGDVYEAVRHPLDTAKAMYDLGVGVLQLFTPDVQPNEEKARAVGQFFAERYGGLENIKRTLAKDPVGAIGDISMVLSGGGSVAARMPSVSGKVGRAAQKAGAYIDPLTIGAKTIKNTAKGVGGAGKHVLGMATGAGAMPFEYAYQAGKNKSQPFLDNMRGKEPHTRVIEDANAEMNRLAQQRLRQYGQDAKRWRGDTTKLTFDDILGEWSDNMDTVVDRGVSLIDDAEQAKINKITQVIEQWEARPELHDARGFDALKRRLDALDINADKFAQADRIRTSLRNQVKDNILEKVPDYADAMKAYEDALTAEKELKRTFSMDRNALTDTTLRKMQSVMRNNVNTNYGRRGEMMKGMDSSGEIMDRLAGQSLTDYSPRGLQKMVAGGTVIGGFGNPLYWAGLPFQSPKLMGELTYGLGATNRKARNLANAARLNPSRARNIGRGAFQTGRAKGILEE